MDFFDNFYAAPMYPQIFVWDSPQEKVEVLKNHQKQKLEVFKKVSFVLFIRTEKFNNLTNFWHYLEDKNLIYQVRTENKS